MSRSILKSKNIHSLKDSSLLRRYLFEKLFKFVSILAIFASISFLGLLIANIGIKAWGAFNQAKIKLEVSLDRELLEADNSYMKATANKKIVEASVRELFPKISEQKELNNLYKLVSLKAIEELYNYEAKHKDMIGNRVKIWFTAGDLINIYLKMGKSYDFEKDVLNHIEYLDMKKLIKKELSLSVLINENSREPELAGIAGALVGTVWTILICMLVAFPLAVFSAIYLEEFAPKNAFTNFIEVNINNLAAVPSIVFGLLGLSFFIGTFGVPRSSALAGGLTLSLMVLPTMIITTRQAIRSIPDSLKYAVSALGASDIQVIFHHVLPLSLPGIMTGAILSISRAIGETAPLIMVGMVAFIVDIPKGIMDAATVMPVQIYLWSDSPELLFIEKTSAAIIVLLMVLMLFNILAVWIRKKYEIRW